jgi:hypothetical protein
MPLDGYVYPEFSKSVFTCTSCGAVSIQKWSTRVQLVGIHELPTTITSLQASWCETCSKIALWDVAEKHLVYPPRAAVPIASLHLPAEVRDAYEEAAKVHPLSPRAAAALLRLALQQLLRTLGKPGKELYSEIGELVADGLPPLVENAMDVIRHHGNDGIHSDTSAAKEDPDGVVGLFFVVNSIGDLLVGAAGRIQRLHGQLPPEVKRAIARRDGTVKS